MARIPDAARASAKKQRRKDADPKTEDPKTDEPKPEQGSGNPNLKELLKGAPLSYQPFPVDALPEPLRSLTIDGAEAIGIDTSYIALPGLVHAAGLVNAARKVIVKPGWLEPCTLWGVTVGSSATGKTQGFKLSHDIAARLHMEFKGLKRDVCVTNVNIASVKKVLKQNPMGTLVSKDELSSFLAMVSKRATGRLAEDIGDWCEMDQAGTLINRRILDSDANIDQTNVCCSIVGTIQPQILFAVTRGQMTDAGVTFRFQFAAPPRKPRVIDRYAVIPDRVTNAWEKCFRKLLKLSGEHHVPLDDEATELFWGDEGYLKRMSDRGATPHSDTHAAAYGKLEGRCARYALVDYLIGCDPGEDGRGPIPGESMRRAIELCEWFAHEDDRLLSLRDENDFDRRLRFIVDRIELRYKGRITLRDLQLLEHLKSASHSLDLAKAICDAGYGTIEVGDRKDSQVLVIRSANAGQTKQESAMLNGNADPEAKPEEANTFTMPSAAPHKGILARTPIGKLSMPAECRNALIQAKIGTLLDLYERHQQTGLPLNIVLQQLVPTLTDKMALRFQIAFFTIANHPKHTRLSTMSPPACKDCGVYIGLGLAEDDADHCAQCRDMGPATIPMPEPAAKASPKLKRNQS